jgi:hypothetical protein
MKTAISVSLRKLANALKEQGVLGGGMRGQSPGSIVRASNETTANFETTSGRGPRIPKSKAVKSKHRNPRGVEIEAFVWPKRETHTCQQSDYEIDGTGDRDHIARESHIIIHGPNSHLWELTGNRQEDRVEAERKMNPTQPWREPLELTTSSPEWTTRRTEGDP